MYCAESRALFNISIEIDRKKGEDVMKKKKKKNRVCLSLSLCVLNKFISIFLTKFCAM